MITFAFWLPQAETPKRAVELFSDILDLRSRADTAFNVTDHLPRVVVVGDQVHPDIHQ